MLELLAKYAKGHGLEAEPGFKPKEVRWAIVCDTDARFLDVVELGDTARKPNRGETFAKCPDLTQPEMKAGGVTKSHFLVETAEIVALLGKNADDAKVRDKHKYFANLLRDAGGAMPELSRLADRLSDHAEIEKIRNRLENSKGRPNDKVTFRLGNQYLVESDTWHEWWRGFRKTLATEKSKKGMKESARPMRCFATGDLVAPALTHPKIERLSDTGGLPMGDVLIGFKQASFRSYGLKQSANAAVSEEAAFAYSAALNNLVKEHGQRLAGAKVVHWFKKKVPREDDPLAWLEVGQKQEELNAQQRARELLESIRTGKRVDLADNEFYALTLSGAGGRVMVRDWIEGQFEELVNNIQLWFEDLAIVHRHGGALARSPKFLAVLGATVRDLNDLPPPFVAKMWRVAVRQEPIPRHAVAQALHRFRVGVVQDDPPNHARMGLIKAYHIRKNRKKGGQTMPSHAKRYLNEEHPHPAYHCGRLMAVYARLQRRAQGDVGAGVVQRYYAAASATPGHQLGRLARLSQFHLNKLEPGLAHWYEEKLASIWARFKEDPPATLNLEEQSLFALGYYQQLAKKKGDEVNEEKEQNNE